MSCRALLRRVLAPVALLAALGAPSSSAAVDGVIEINDARAQQGGVTPGDAPGYPVTIDQPGSYRLTGDLFVSGTNLDVVVIDASHVVLDLNGFSIRCLFALTPCKGNGSGVGVSIAPVANVVVRNGTIRDMPSFAIEGPAQALEDVRILENGGGIVGAVAVRRAAIVRNGGTGVFSNADVVDCFIVDNDAAGVSIREGSVRDSRIARNGGSGVVVSGGNAAAVIVGNVITDNGSFGISASAPSLYRSNVLFGNGTQEVQVSGSVVNRGENVCGSDTACP